MEVLSREIIFYGWLNILYALIIGAFLGFVLSTISREWGYFVTSLLVFLIIGIGICITEKPQEKVKVIVSDWNVVHSEEWEILKKKGEIVTLKRSIEEDEVEK